MKLITNIDKDNNHGTYISKLIESSNKIIISSGWMKINGVKLLKKSLEKALQNKAEITIYSNFKNNNTEEKATVALKKHEGIKHILVKKGQILHSKIYYFEKDDTFTALIGSANITCGGLKESEELSVEISGNIGSDEQIEIRKYLNHLSEEYQK